MGEAEAEAEPLADPEARGEAVAGDLVPPSGAGEGPEQLGEGVAIGAAALCCVAR